MWKLRDINKAETIYTRALQAHPNDNLMKTYLVSAFIDAGKFNRAQITINEIIEDDPEFAPAYRSKADLYYWQGNGLAESQMALSQNLRLSIDDPFSSMLMSQIYVLSGDRDKAIAWLKRGLTLAPNSNYAEASQALVDSLHGQYDKAFDVFVQLPPNQHVFPIYMFDLFEVGKKLHRLPEVEAHFRNFSPNLFKQNIDINASNFIAAISVARLLREKGQLTQSDTLLDKCLNVVSTAPYGGWSTRESDWKTRIYLAKDQLDLAALAFAEYVDTGHASHTVLNSPTYSPLKPHPTYQAALAKMQSYLQHTRAKLRHMESTGQIVLPEDI
ncbi:tetratricopeptide repeat protein [Agaribacter flavus]|uniref:Tetratricopeptide repeat protein n=1 Tax=Agaribacter flavus TaxID=1902781 RepID=A0ABV7FVE9_9ALTE